MLGAARKRVGEKEGTMGVNVETAWEQIWLFVTMAIPSKREITQDHI